MPQICQIIGVNSVTNIELEAGVMPAPIIRNADWFENTYRARTSDRVLFARQVGAWAPLSVHAMRIRSSFLARYRIVANGRFTRAGTRWG